MQDEPKKPLAAWLGLKVPMKASKAVTTPSTMHALSSYYTTNYTIIQELLGIKFVVNYSL